MFEVNERVSIPDEEFDWKYARAGGPGGQNVNKVASKATLTWLLAESPSVPDVVKERLPRLHSRYFTNEGVFQITSQRYRDQERNRQDCLEKLKVLIEEALTIPKTRRATKPTRGSRRRRLEDKKRRSDVKSARQKPGSDE